MHGGIHSLHSGRLAALAGRAKVVGSNEQGSQLGLVRLRQLAVS
jgi:hypothetical protein